MRSYLFKNPEWFDLILKDATWRKKTEHREIYLTFDDGPHPAITPWVLKLLRQYQAKATFFTIGSKVQEHTDTFIQIMDEGHTVGNHSFSHVNGWKTPNKAYLEDIEKARQVISHFSNSLLFRPPYGKMTFDQYRMLKSWGGQIIMWSHMAGDFDSKLNIEKSMGNLKASAPGSILLFHDSEGAFKNLKEMLPIVLDHFSTLGYQFKKL